MGRPGTSEKEEAVRHLRRPEALDLYYTIPRGTAGMETLVLLARETPLERDLDLQEVSALHDSGGVTEE